MSQFEICKQIFFQFFLTHYKLFQKEDIKMPTLFYELKPFALLAGAWLVSTSVPESAILKLSVLALTLAGVVILYMRYDYRYARKRSAR